MSMPVKGMSVALNRGKGDFHLAKIIMIPGFLNIAMSDNVLSEAIDNLFKYHRLNQNIAQNEVSRAAGISRSTLSLLEK